MASFFEQISGHSKAIKAVKIMNQAQLERLEEIKCMIIDTKKHGGNEVQLKLTPPTLIIKWLRDEGFDVHSETEEQEEWRRDCKMSSAYDILDCHRNCPKTTFNTIWVIRWPVKEN